MLKTGAMKTIILQTVMLSTVAIIDTSFIKNEIIIENDHEFSIETSKGIGVIKKTEEVRTHDILLSKLYVKHDTHHVTGDPVITIYRYVPDFYEDEAAFSDFYDLAYYDVVTKELQNHAAFKHLAVDGNGELVSRAKWEADQ